MDITGMTDVELVTLTEMVAAEQTRRSELARAERRIDAVIREFADAQGRDLSGAEPWARPSHALDAYPVGAAVTHEGRVWDSLTPANTGEPGVSGWRERATVVDGNPVYPAWVAPTGAHDAYRAGERVTFDGQVWESLIDGNVWSVHVHPQGWMLIEEAVSEPEPPAETEPENPEPEPGPMPEPEPEPDPEDGESEPDPEEPETYPGFAQPTAENPYSLGDRVIFEGQVWESTLDGNVWSPADYPQGWQLIE